MPLIRFAVYGAALPALISACFLFGCGDAGVQNAAGGAPGWADGVIVTDDPAAMPDDPADGDGGCTREILNAAVDSYVEAFTAGDYTLMPLAQNARYIENDNTVPKGEDRIIPFGDGLWQGPLPADYRHTNLLDVEQCAAYTEVVVATNDPQYILGVKIVVNTGEEVSVKEAPRIIPGMKKAAEAGFKISEVNLVLTQKGDWGFNADNWIKFASAEDWAPLPADNRLSRPELLRAAELFLEYFSDRSVEPLWGNPCARLEGGAYTGDREDCSIGAPNLPMKVTVFWHLIDEVNGMVVLYNYFGGSDTHTYYIPPTGYRYIHTMTAMKREDVVFHSPQ
ncbi:MAG: hypothetical protein FWB85_07210 [Chitinispirillia bacterium]|nr:hypothetical protein [Chitinispirillia bacterium]MCL2242036.1 hypothetical protein [Chitinispirillia bacterium]